MEEQPKNDLYTSVLLEGVRSDFKAVAEVVEHLSHKMGKMDDRLTRVENKLDDHIVQSAIEHRVIEEKIEKVSENFSKEMQVIHVRLDKQDRDRLN
jgi:hypothetical protein